MRRAAFLASLALLVLPANADLNAKPRGSQRSAEQMLRPFLRDYFRADQEELRRGFPDQAPIHYAAALFDLNGDGRPEAIVHIMSAAHCGSGGCRTFIFTPEGQAWRLVTHMTISRPPIRVLPTSSHGWRDLGVFVAGGGIIPGFHALIPFDGTTYASNPSVPPARELRRTVRGRILISPNERGRPLF